jgi:hypothetical protein
MISGSCCFSSSKVFSHKKIIQKYPYDSNSLKLATNNQHCIK